MDKHEMEEKIAEVSKTVLSYCIARTSNWHDAEDMAQEILLEIAKSAPNIRDDRAIYGFIWAIARNVCKKWVQNKQTIQVCALSDNMQSDKNDLDAVFDEKSDIQMLRRELSLLSGKYRRATILYYLQNKSCAEIASLISVSESMVKYLLFKSRSILKEGMNMERNYGEQSYHPKKLNILYMGEGPNHYWNLVGESKIRQNILWACYNDRLTEHQIALQIGVSLPYIEDDLEKLTETWLLQKEGNYYKTNIIILTEDFNREKNEKLILLQKKIAGKMKEFIDENEKHVREIGFYGSGMSLHSLRWHVATMLLFYAYSAIGDPYFTKNNVPETAYGEHAFVWGAEKVEGGFNCCSIIAPQWKTSISMYFMDWLKNQSVHHSDLYGNASWVKVYDKISHGATENLNEHEQEIAAQLIRKGYAVNRHGKIAATMPVYTKKQLALAVELQKKCVAEIGALFQKIYAVSAKVLNNHVPVHLKKQVSGIAAMSVFHDGAYVPALFLNQDGYLSDDWTAGEIATSYVVLE